MRTLLLAGTSLLALSASMTAAKAVPVGYETSFGQTSGAQIYLVPTAGIWRVTAIGAMGGAAYNAPGGYGAEVSGELDLSANEALSIAVGGRGSDGPTGFNQGSGGGGSFVIGPNNTPLAIAGGGGAGGSVNSLNATYWSASSDTGGGAPG